MSKSEIPVFGTLASSLESDEDVPRPSGEGRPASRPPTKAESSAGLSSPAAVVDVKSTDPTDLEVRPVSQPPARASAGLNSPSAVGFGGISTDPTDLESPTQIRDPKPTPRLQIFLGSSSRQNPSKDNSRSDPLPPKPKTPSRVAVKPKPPSQIDSKDRPVFDGQGNPAICLPSGMDPAELGYVRNTVPHNYSRHCWKVPVPPQIPDPPELVPPELEPEIQDLKPSSVSNRGKLQIFLNSSNSPNNAPKANSPSDLLPKPKIPHVAVKPKPPSQIDSKDHPVFDKQGNPAICLPSGMDPEELGYRRNTVPHNYSPLYWAPEDPIPHVIPDAEVPIPPEIPEAEVPIPPEIPDPLEGPDSRPT